LAKKASEKKEKAVKEKAVKAEKASHKAEEKHVSKGEKHEKKAAHGHEAEKHEKAHAKKAEEKHGHKEKGIVEEELESQGEKEAVHEKKGHAHNEEGLAELEEAVSGEEGHAGHREKKRKPKKGKEHKVDFVELKPAEITEAIVHLANEGHSSSEIGMMLRDQYGVPMVGKAMGKKLCAILGEQGLLPPVPDDMMSLIRKSVTLREHLARNKKDMSAKRGLMLTVSKIRSLEKYYKKRGKISMEWRYSAETAALLAK
jgi:small subunit ribosomal protein S15